MTDDAIRNLRSTDHFIQQLDLGMESLGERSMRCVAESAQPADVGLLGTIVDVLGGALILRLRPQAGLPTTNLEIFGADHLREPGRIEVDATLVALSKRRATIEAVIDVAGQRAFATAGFVVRDDFTQPPAPFGSARPPRFGHVLAQPVWQRIGARQVAGGAEVAIERRLYNNATALQGGATIALLEAAALTAIDPSELLAGASIIYLQQVRGNVASARIRERIGHLVIVDVVTDEIEGACATGVFRIARRVGSNDVGSNDVGSNGVGSNGVGSMASDK